MNARVADLPSLRPEPLVRLSDLDEYRQGLAKRLSGEWDEDKWTSFRVRFGVYGQRQPGVQMVRIKIPGGIVPVQWLRVLAGFNRNFCQADAHITTRQDFQTYFVPLARTAEALEYLYSNGVTTREACGNTLRNMNACALAGACPREHVDAGEVAERLALSWLRHPLVQHMPRKVKITVSGCETDCGASGLHDLGFVATTVTTAQGALKGFKVYGGGGLGGWPRAAVLLLDFVAEELLPAVVEALARLHQRYSDRKNRNASRVKFLIKRFGEEKFIALYREEFERIKALPQRPWTPLTWRRPEAVVANPYRTPVGVVPGHDGRATIVADVPLGVVSTAQFEALADIAEGAGVTRLRTTRDQNIALEGVPAHKLERVVEQLKAIGYGVPTDGVASPDVISCPGTTTCRIGITNSQNLGRQVVEAIAEDPNLKGLAVRISGCQNSCGLHHVGDFGFHGMAKKLDGRAAPHYQIHLGGDPRLVGAIAEAGPIIAAKHAPQAVKLLGAAYASGKQAGETVRAWADRLGKDGINQVLKPLESTATEAPYVDWGDQAEFVAPPPAKGDCAAPFAMDALYPDLADDALIKGDRALLAGQWQVSLASYEEAVTQAGRWLLFARNGAVAEDDAPALVRANVGALVAADPELGAALSAIDDQRVGALSSGKAEAYRDAVAYWIDSVRAAVAQPVAVEAATGFDAQAFAGLE